MKLKEIQIENFRSIKSQKIILDHNCLILVGKNEASKSNILKAIAAVFGQYQVTDKDKRKWLENERITNYFIFAKIELSKSDFNEIFDRFHEKYKNIECIAFRNKKTIHDFIEICFSNIALQINIANENKSYLTLL